jgi:serine/threonine protein kinase
MTASAAPPVVVGRYAIFDRIAAGGMAAVHVARLVGEGGFARTVAVKRLHPQFALDPEFVAMFLDEARLAARIRHPNVVATLDIVTANGEPFLVMEYVDGESLSVLLRTARERGAAVPVDVAAGILVQVLHGLHAAHEARNDLGEPLGMVHRDVSPQNVLVGVDGVARVLDFGVAKALGKLHTTREGQLKGKLGYLSPEQVFGHPVTRRSDVFAAAVVLWETIAGRRLFAAESEGNVLQRIMEGVVVPPSTHAPGAPAALDDVVMRGLAREPADRFDDALAMAEAIERAAPAAPPRVIASWVKELASDRLAARAQLLASIESSTAGMAGAQPVSASVSIAAHPTVPDARETGRTSISVATDRAASAPPKRSGWRSVAVGGVALGAIAAVAIALGRVGREPRAGSSAAATHAMTAADTTAPAPNASTPPFVLPTETPASSARSASSADDAHRRAPAPSAVAPPRPNHPAVRSPRPRAPAAGAPTPAPSGSGLYTRE